MKQLKEERRKVVGRVGEEMREEMKKIKNRIERKRKARRRWMMREKINELEVCYQKRDTGKY